MFSFLRDAFVDVVANRSIDVLCTRPTAISIIEGIIATNLSKDNRIIGLVAEKSLVKFRENY